MVSSTKGRARDRLLSMISLLITTGKDNSNSHLTIAFITYTWKGLLHCERLLEEQENFDYFEWVHTDHFQQLGLENPENTCKRHHCLWEERTKSGPHVCVADYTELQPCYEFLPIKRKISSFFFQLLMVCQ
ncbi:hypothetical protein QQ045_028006 [Rhodiola kirilowii]